MRFNSAALTDIGRKRQQNQDSFAADPDLGLFVVADGMGGHKGGEIASAVASEVITEVVQNSTKASHWNARHVLKDAIHQANHAIFQRAFKETHLNGMGTTVTAVLFQKRKIIIGHVGDSRCYFLKNHRIWQATRDHSLVQEKLRAGLITRDQVGGDRMKNVITRSVGYEPEIEIDLYEMEVEPGDAFLLCSDGLSGQISDTQMLQIVQEFVYGQKNTENAVQEMIKTANQNGGDDNITAVLVEILPT